MCISEVIPGSPALIMKNVNWTDMCVFTGIDINDSFVLTWELMNSKLQFNLEVSVWPSSKYYNEPKSNNYTCYRSAILVFENVVSIDGLQNMASVRPVTDASGTTDYGNIDTLVKTEVGFLIEGSFGSVRIEGGELKIEIHA